MRLIGACIGLALVACGSVDSIDNDDGRVPAELSLFANVCGASCESGDACFGVGSSQATSCATSCDDLARLADTAGCEDVARSLATCVDALNGCSSETQSCASQASAFSRCIGTYCAAHVGAKGCG